MYTIEEAAEILGLKPCTLVQKYMAKYHQKASTGRRNAKFNVDQYLKDKELEDELVSKTGLFVEYLRHIEDITYTEMSNKTGICLNSINQLRFGMDSAMKFCQYYREKETNLWDNFHTYYNWRS